MDMHCAGRELWWPATVGHPSTVFECAGRISRGQGLVVTKAPLLARLSQETLREIEPLLCLGQLLLDIVQTPLERIEPRGNLDRWSSSMSGTHTNYHDRRG
jgi:hypothetical protein